MADNQNIKNRLFQYIEYKGISARKFSTECGFSANYATNISKGIPEDKIHTISVHFPDLNPVWLMTGEGDMLKVDATASSVDEVEQRERMAQDNIILVPVLNLDARGGLLPNVENDVPEFVADQMPFSADIARQGDFAMIVSGDSMYPRYPSGSYLLLREIPMWHEYLELSVPYLLELQDGRRVAKIVTKGADKEHYVLKSVNPDFEDTEIGKAFIRRVFQIVVLLKKEII